MAPFLSRSAWSERAGAARGGTAPGALRKEFTAEVSPGAHGPGSRVRTFTITTSTPDRDRDVIAADGWQLENFKKNPVVLFAHDYHDLPVGKCVDIRQTPTSLVADVEFAPKEVYPFADTVLGLVDFGALKATSVGFEPKEWTFNEERKGYDIRQQELLEFSIVPVPANAEALQLAVKGMGAERFEPYRKWVERAHDVVKSVVGCPRGSACPNEGKQPVDCPAQDCPQRMPTGVTPAGQTAINLENFFLESTIPITKPGGTEYACRLQDPGKFSEFRRGERTHAGKTYGVIYGKPKDGGGWEQQSFRYSHGTWGSDDAKSHCQSHSGRWEAGVSFEIEKVEGEKVVPGNPSGAGAADEGATWSAPTLADFTDKAWGDLSDTEKRGIARHYAWADAMPPSSFGACKLPHHDPKSHDAVWRGVANAMARLNQAQGVDKEAVYRHLAAHYRQFGKEPPKMADILAEKTIDDHDIVIGEAGDLVTFEVEMPDEPMLTFDPNDFRELLTASVASAATEAAKAAMLRLTGRLPD